MFQVRSELCQRWLFPFNKVYVYFYDDNICNCFSLDLYFLLLSPSPFHRPGCWYDIGTLIITLPMISHKWQIHVRPRWGHYSMTMLDERCLKAKHCSTYNLAIRQSNLNPRSSSVETISCPDVSPTHQVYTYSGPKVKLIIKLMKSLAIWVELQFTPLSQSKAST